MRIELKEVTKEYNKTPILQNVNLTIEERDVYGIIGKSGSGKTTLLNLMTGFIEPTEGSINYFTNSGEALELQEHHHKIKKHLGFTPQQNSFYPKLTVKENLFHFGKLYGLKPETLLANVKGLLQVTQLFDHRNKLSEHLAKGMQRRLDIACSLIHKPKILVLDEPTADLDPLLQKEILSLLQEVNQQGVTIVLASHHLDNIEDICNKVAIIHERKVHSHGLIDEVKKPFLRNHFTINLRAGSNKELLISALRKLPVEKIVDQGSYLLIYPKNIETTVSSLLKFIKEENLFLHDMNFRKPTLHEVFENITLKK